MEAVKRLLEARLALEIAAVEFLDACTALKTTALSSLVSFSKQIASENVVQSVLSSVDSVRLVQDHAYVSLAALNELLNMSPSRVPINRLPPEILGHIFSFVVATSTCDHRHREDTFMVLSLVCTKWHQVATNTPSLWTHIDINFTCFLPATALGRARKLLDRCHNMPVHIHFDGGHEVEPADVLDIVATLQPHVGFLSSLYITNTRLHSLICGLLGLVSGPGAANSLKRLSLYSIDMTDGRDGLRSLPVNILQGLTQLELVDLGELACPSMEDTLRVLSDCPALHTLRLINLDVQWDRLLHGQNTIPLPNLRFLEITRVNCTKVLLFLSHIAPGALPLDVRLDADYTVEHDESTLPGQVFLALANVVSLYMNFYHHRPAHQRFESLFTCVPSLRLLRLNVDYHLHSEVARILAAKTTNASSPALPILQSLCLCSCRICPETANWLKQITEIRGLSNLVFLGCTYPSSFLRPKNHQETHGNMSLIGHNYSAKMPGSMKEWFLEHVGKVVIDTKLQDAKVYRGRDAFVQGLITID
ncbi:hypothetical protein FRC12_018968 [Ceratobasidium sp. 428]|nr:hypothetical protein FRC12_018968 [Ceratobasidium sp. 428]